MVSIPASASPQQYEFQTILRHRWPLRAMHWINLLCMIALVGSGLRIFNAHTALYWGEVSHFDTPLFATRAIPEEDGELRGVTLIGARSFDTTGVLGASPAAQAAAPKQKVRFVAKGLKSQRNRLGLSAADYGRLVGVSAQSVYNWELGQASPRADQVKAIPALRGIGKQESKARL